MSYIFPFIKDIILSITPILTFTYVIWNNKKERRIKRSYQILEIFAEYLSKVLESVSENSITMSEEEKENNLKNLIKGHSINQEIDALEVKLEMLCSNNHEFSSLLTQKEDFFHKDGNDFNKWVLELKKNIVIESKF